jgi:hypothetical protein
MRFVEKIFTELKGCNNIYYEICHQPYATEKVTVQDVHTWQIKLLDQLLVLKRRYQAPHLVFCQGVYGHAALTAAADSYARYLEHPGVDAVVILQNFQLNNAVYAVWSGEKGERIGLPALAALGEAGQLTLDKPLLVSDGPETPCPVDEAIGIRQRKRAWAALCSGLHMLGNDYSFTTHDPRGMAGKKGIRKYIAIMREFFGTCDFAHCRFLAREVSEIPLHTIPFFIGDSMAAYYGYLADSREPDEPGYGETIEGKFTLSIGSGKYQITFFSPATGDALSQPHELHGGIVHLKVPAFRHDLAFKIIKQQR